MAYDPYFIPTLGFNDLILIAIVEVVFIWFFFPKELLGKVFTMVGAANLVKIGIMSLVYPIIPSLTITMNQVLLVEVTALFIIGIVISTIIYENEQWAQTRDQAGALAFRITSLSSLVWVTFKSIQPHLGSGIFTERSVFTSLSAEMFQDKTPGSAFEVLDLPIFGLALFLIGLGIIYYHYRKQSVTA
ncbi:MAG: hypothetical protein ACTSR2_13345 [Candidatus Hodarchaeales archaeon]